MKDVCFVKGSALMIFYLVNEYGDYGFLHPYFKKICKELPHFPTFEMIYILELLHRYCLIFFNEKIYPNKAYPQDLDIFLTACDKLLRSMHSEVLVQIGNIFLDFPNENRISNVIIFLFCD